MFPSEKEHHGETSLLQTSVRGTILGRVALPSSSAAPVGRLVRSLDRRTGMGHPSTSIPAPYRKARHLETGASRRTRGTLFSGDRDTPSLLAVGRRPNFVATSTLSPGMGLRFVSSRSKPAVTATPSLPSSPSTRTSNSPFSGSPARIFIACLLQPVKLPRASMCSLSISHTGPNLWILRRLSSSLIKEHSEWR